MPKSYSFFLGANSENGFVSYYNSVDSDEKNTAIFNVIGGPGTGKSTLMKKIEKNAVEKDYECERYFCSSDPSSLDGLRVVSKDRTRSVFICDATAPHSRELTTPGAVTRIVDLTSCWNEKMLQEKRDTIINLQNMKKQQYNTAYKYLKLAGMSLREAVNLREAAFDKERVLKSLSLTKNSTKDTVTVFKPIRSISMFGEKLYDNKGYTAKTRISVKNEVDCAILCNSILKSYQNTGEIWIAPNPIVNEYYDEVYFKDLEICISLGDLNGEDFKDINACGSDNEKDLKKIVELYTYFKEAALEHLYKAREAHFELENIYGNAMNFDKKDEIDEATMNVISHILQ